MRFSRCVSVLACSVVLACSQAGLSLREERVIQQAVEAQLNAWVRAINNREVDSVVSFYDRSPELTVIGADGHVSHGWDEESARLKEMFADLERVNFVKQNPQIEILSADLALTTFRHSLDIVSNGSRRLPSSGSVTVLWVRDRDDGAWRIHTEHISVTPSPN
ncbi:MAG: YybH family protein [Gemmatimonadales bacterium]